MKQDGQMFGRKETREEDSSGCGELYAPKNTKPCELFQKIIK